MMIITITEIKHFFIVFIFFFWGIVIFVVLCIVIFIIFFRYIFVVFCGDGFRCGLSNWRDRLVRDCSISSSIFSIIIGVRVFVIGWIITRFRGLSQILWILLFRLFCKLFGRLGFRIFEELQLFIVLLADLVRGRRNGIDFRSYWWTFCFLSRLVVSCSSVLYP